ncbi:MAG: hypothetical protein AB8F74_16105 [Saprospiraceae bacterium]
MRFPQEAHRSSVYLNFKEIDSAEFHSIVHFFEQNEEDIQLLTLEEYFEMHLAYITALFEVGAYTSFLASCDDAIESVINFNIEEYNGEAVYHSLLFRKAISLYHLMKYEQSEKILWQLARMRPEKEVVSFLKKCKRAQPPKIVRKSRVVRVLLFISAAFVIAVELTIIKKLMPEIGMETEYFRNGLFIVGWLILAGSGLWLRVMVAREVKTKLSLRKIH